MSQINKIISSILIAIFLFYTLEAMPIDIETNRESQMRKKKLFKDCLDSIRVKEDYISVLYNDKPYLGLSNKDLSEHDMYRIECLITGRYEDWEVGHLAEKYFHRNLFYKRNDNTYINKLNNEEFVDSELARLRKEIESYPFYLNANLVDVIYYFNLKQFCPIIVDYLKNNPQMVLYDYVEFKMALMGDEWCLSNAIKKYGYNRKIKKVSNPYNLFFLGTSYALYEIAKGLNSDKLCMKNYMFKDGEIQSPMKYLYLGYLIRGVENCPFKENTHGIYTSNYGEMPPKKIPKDELKRIKRWFKQNKDNLKVNRDESFEEQLYLMFFLQTGY